MRQTRAPGEKLFVDYAKQTVPIVVPTTWVVPEAQLFVAVSLPFSAGMQLG